MKRITHKTYKESWFEYVWLGNSRSKELFNKYSDVVVVQVTPCEDTYVIVELMNKKGYEKYCMQREGE